MGSIAGVPLGNKIDEGNSPAIDAVRSTSIELVQLSSGKIVAADSEEGRAFKALGSAEGDATGQTRAVASLSAPGQEHAPSEVTNDDEVHMIWADMGLSRRAWSRSPSPPPGARHQPLNPSGSV